MLTPEEDYQKCLESRCSLCAAPPGKPCDRYGGIHAQRGRAPCYVKEMGIFLGGENHDEVG